jgi:hypothetical protein
LYTISKRYEYILLIVNAFSRRTEAFPIGTQNAKEVGSILHNEVFIRYGAPCMLLSDRGQDTTLRLTITTQTVQLSTKIVRLLLLFELIGEIGQLCFQVSG